MRLAAAVPVQCSARRASLRSILTVAAAVLCQSQSFAWWCRMQLWLGPSLVMARRGVTHVCPRCPSCSR